MLQTFGEVSSLQTGKHSFWFRDRTGEGKWGADSQMRPSPLGRDSPFNPRTDNGAKKGKKPFATRRRKTRMSCPFRRSILMWLSTMCRDGGMRSSMADRRAEQDHSSAMGFVRQRKVGGGI